jgi:hypothetical protein
MSEIAHQATCIALEGRALLIEGAPGIGKSSLALALIDRGAVLVADDGVMLEPRAGRLLARPHANTRGLLEVRNLGVLAFPVREEARVALVLVLDREAPRFIEAAEPADRAGIALPCLRLWPDGSTLALKAELALARYGLT